MSTKKTLLVVDDSKVSRMMICKIVKERHPEWTLEEAANGEEALQKAQQVEIDFYSVDLNMPGMDGIELIEQLLVKYSDAKIVLLTANVQENVIEIALKLGAACVHKPINEESIDKMLSILNA